MSTPKKTTTKKTSVTTEVVLGQAAQQITKAVNELNQAVNTVNELSSQVEELSLLVSNKEAQIEELDVIYAEKARQAEVDLNLRLKFNAENVVLNWLRENGKTTISQTDLDKLNSELATVKNSVETEVKKAIAQTTSTIKTQYENEIKLIHSENKAMTAENSAKIGTLTTQNKFLESQVEKLYSQLEAERAAGTERAKAASIGSINLNEPNRK